MKQWTQAAFVGGHPALDFLNTVSDHGKTRAQSDIAEWEDFIAWASASRAFPEAVLPALKTRRRIADRRAALAGIHHLRETAYGVLKRLAAGSEPRRRDRLALEAAIKTALAGAHLTRSGTGYCWSIRSGETGWIVNTLSLHLEDLLRREDLDRLRECGRCTWLFLDRGRGRGRRWCDMRTCGNRAKVEAFRSR